MYPLVPLIERPKVDTVGGIQAGTDPGGSSVVIQVDISPVPPGPSTDPSGALTEKKNQKRENCKAWHGYGPNRVC